MEEKLTPLQLVAQQELEQLRALFSQQEIEDCLFEVFRDAYLYDSDVPYIEREKRAMLHAALRKIIRTQSKNSNLKP
ncbi:hypothetical protein [Riemerella columbina]|uniref:hypothetical protein n=1 Tax=Riemerella columbina TaxID=103810 RepID=UPI000379E1A4|nr:hypothetical protein [Riemerella columbina]